MSEGKYQVWSRYGFEDEKLIQRSDDLMDAANVADIEAAWGVKDVRVWEQLEDGEMTDVHISYDKGESLVDEY